MELRIDGQPCDLGTKAIAVPGYNAAKLADPEACREGAVAESHDPGNAPQRRRGGLCPGTPHAAGRFNETLHTAELTAEGSTLIGGTVRLLASSEAGYTLEIRDGGAGWAENAARRMFSALGVAWQGELTPTTVFESWTNASP